ncbi:uncharacterized protein [Nicotiana tomentosiformis]|uniref:uncharacterized protein n=1 Tax=Nicotiana tomentosiformis TaxID=4098 RepID=UPI00388CABD1
MECETIDLNNNDPLGSMPLGDVDVEDDQVEEVSFEPQANRRGRPPKDNVLVPPPNHQERLHTRCCRMKEQCGFFTGAPNQNAYKHLKGFVDTCWGSKQTKVSEDALRLRLFTFSLRGKALDWLERLPNHSIHTWDELAEKFISKFFYPGHMATLRDGILTFKQEPNEPLHGIWERYRTMVKECPNNDMMETIIQQNFCRGINTTNQCVVNQLVGGNFMTTPYAKACDILYEMADTSSAWQSRANFPQGDPNTIHLHKELDDHGQAIAKLTTTMNQLARAQLQQLQALNTRPKGTLPSDTVVNPKDGNNMGHATAVTTRSGKGGDAPTSSQRKIVDDEKVVQEDDIPNNVVQANDEVRIDIDDNVKDIQEEVNPSREHIVDIPELVVPKAKEPMLRPPPPYPQILAKQNGKNQFKKFIDMIKSLSINVPLMTHQVSAVVHSMTPKLEDPDAFTIPFTIGSADFTKALCNLGANINLMPYSIFKTLGIWQPRPISMGLHMEDRTMKRPLGIIDDVLVHVYKFILSADFVILDCEVDYEVPIILGRPFLTMGKALIDVEVGELTFRAGDEKAVLNVCKYMRQPNSNEVCSFVDLVTIVIIDDTSVTMNVDDTLEDILLNLDDDETCGYVECMNSLQGMRAVHL